MLSRFIKHEFRATGRRMLPTLGVLALLGLLANLSIRVLESGFGGTLLRILMVLFIAAFFALYSSFERLFQYRKSSSDCDMFICITVFPSDAKLLS